MKKEKSRVSLIVGSIVLLLSSAGFLSGSRQDADSARPKNPAAGRIRTLTPVLTITDENESDFYFRRPSQPQFGPVGSIYLLDQKQILRFDAQGRFVRNYFRPGQGPGELNYVQGYAFDGSALIVLGASPAKFVRYDPEGNDVTETSIPQDVGPVTLLGCEENQAIVLKNIYPRLGELKESEGTVENQNPILAIPLAGGREKQIGIFSTRTYYKVSSAGSVGGGAMAPYGKYLIVPWGKETLALFENEEYAVKILDTATGNVIRTLRRPYPRIKTPLKDRDGISSGVMVDGKAVKRPAPKYTADIVHLLARDEELWVITSTKIKGKGVLVDVFNREGVFADSFYLPVPEWPEKHLTRPDPIALQGEFLLCLEKTDEGTYLLRKYQIGN